MNSSKEKSSLAIADKYLELLLQKFAPPCILINLQEKVLLMSGEIEKHFPITGRTPGRLLSNYVDKIMYAELLKGIREVLHGEESVMIDGNTFNTSTSFYIYISSIAAKSQKETLILIEFEEADKLPANAKNTSGSISAHDIQQQIDALSYATDHDVKNLIANFIMLLNLEETSYSKKDKIRDIKKIQEQFLSKLQTNLSRLLNCIKGYVS